MKNCGTGFPTISHYHLDNGKQIEFVNEEKTSKSIKYTNESEMVAIDMDTKNRENNEIALN